MSTILNIATYSSLIRYDKHNNTQAEILLYDKNNAPIGQLFFMAEGQATKPSSNQNNVIRIFYPFSAYPVMIDMLKSNQAVRVHYESATNAFLSTALIQVGDTQGKDQFGFMG